MPMIKFEGREAIRIRKSNTVAHWGNRNEDNRVEPVAKPAFAVPFKLKKGEPIFTIGSCFARNVETELLRQGFKVPMRELFEQREYSNFGPEIVNNFGTPSIYNEFAWAFGEQPYDEDSGFVEVRPGLFLDLHLVSSIRPAPIEEVRARRKALHAATRSLSKCRVLIMTLGLVELWYDTEGGDYLNTAPLPSTLNRFPDRFELHVLGYDDCYRYLRQAFDIAFEHGRDDLQVVLTVSPVPMMLTHRPCDVMVANSYSKSVLRAVAEQIAEESDRVTYFPSYESVTISDRRVAWMDDLVHVTEDLVSFNVQRMVRAFTGKGAIDPADPVAGDIPSESGEALLMVDRAQDARQRHDDAFFEKEAHRAATSPGFAIEYARHLQNLNRYQKALDLIVDDDSVPGRILRGELLNALGREKEAIEAVRPLCRRGVKGHAQWRIRLDSGVRMASGEVIDATRTDWLEADPRRETSILTHIGSAYRRAQLADLAVQTLEEAALRTDARAATMIELATARLEQGRYDEAEQAIDGVQPEIEAQEKRMAAIRERIAAERQRIEQARASG